MKQAYLMVDIGTGNARVGIVSEKAEVLTVQTCNTVFRRDELYSDAWFFDPEQLWKDICRLVQQVLAALQEPVHLMAVTATSARESIILLDETMHAFAALPNIDNRGLDYLNQIQDGDMLYRKTGRWVSPVFSAMKLVGLREKRLDLYKRVYRITSISDWIGYQMTGVLRYEYSQACETQLLDIQTLNWSETLCEAFHLDKSMLPPLVEAGSCLGEVKKDLCQMLHLPEKLPYIVGAADTQVAALGVQAGARDLVLVSGTTSPVVRVMDTPLYDEKKRCWIDCHTKRGTYLLESNAGVSGLNYQRMKALFFANDSYEELDYEMKKRADDRVLASFGTLIFQENRSLYRGGFLMQAPLAADVDRFDFARAVALDIAFSIYCNIRNQFEIFDQKAPCFLGCGGGLQSKFIAQTISSLSDLPLLLPEHYSQASLLGCAFLCMQALEKERPQRKICKQFIPEGNRETLLERFENWKDYRICINTK